MRSGLLAVCIVLGGCQAANQPVAGFQPTGYYQPPARTLADPNWNPAAITGDHGSYPASYESIIKGWYAENLKDPTSVIYGRISKPRKEHAVTNQFRREVVHGYSVCASVNAKNGYGGYTGQKQRWFLIRNGQIVRTSETRFGEIYIGHRMNCDDGPSLT